MCLYFTHVKSTYKSRLKRLEPFCIWFLFHRNIHTQLEQCARPAQRVCCVRTCRTPQSQALRLIGHHRIRLSVGQDITDSDSAMESTLQSQAQRWSGHHRVRLSGGQDITDSDFAMDPTYYRVRLYNGQDITESGSTMGRTTQSQALQSAHSVSKFCIFKTF